MNIEERLIRQCIKGDKRAQICLYDQSYSYMMSICIRYCKDNQEAGARLNLAFLKILDHLKDYDSSCSLKAWISKITLRSIIDEFRAQQKHYQQHVYQGQIVQEPQWTNGEYSRHTLDIDADQIMEMIQQLSFMDRQVFNLFAIDGYSHKEIAALLDISEGTSKWHVHEARKKLKEHLSKTYKMIQFK